MDQYDIRELTPDGLDDAFALSSAAGWNQRIDDWRMLLALAPRGCFAAWSRDQMVGTAIGIDYGGFGWIAMMLVHPAHRKRGLGRRLLEAAVNAVPSDRLMRLDATPLGRPLYQSYGFVDEARLTRFVAPAIADRAAASAEPGETSLGVRPLGRADLARVVDVDARVFGGNRHAVLEWALAAAPELSWILQNDGDVPEYCFGRRGRLYTQIGPVVTNADPGARALVTAAIRAARAQPIMVDAVDDYATFSGWLRTCGFEAQRPLFRMQRPPANGSGARFTRRTSLPAERAVLGPELA
jgi:GNAT superfamily N-acetyltransferase